MHVVYSAKIQKQFLYGSFYGFTSIINTTTDTYYVQQFLWFHKQP